jgi:hypothetical protein
MKYNNNDGSSVTVGELVRRLQLAVADGHCTPDTLCNTEGCDCVGGCSGFTCSDDKAELTLSRGSD